MSSIYEDIANYIFAELSDGYIECVFGRVRQEEDYKLPNLIMFPGGGNISKDGVSGNPKKNESGTSNYRNIFLEGSAFIIQIEGATYQDVEYYKNRLLNIINKKGPEVRWHIELPISYTFLNDPNQSARGEVMELQLVVKHFVTNAPKQLYPITYAHGTTWVIGGNESDGYC